MREHYLSVINKPTQSAVTELCSTTMEKSIINWKLNIITGNYIVICWLALSCIKCAWYLFQSEVLTYPKKLRNCSINSISTETICVCDKRTQRVISILHLNNSINVVVTTCSCNCRGQMWACYARNARGLAECCLLARQLSSWLH